MNSLSLPIMARRSFQYFWRQHLAFVASAAAATAILIGALVVGDSVRGSLRTLVLDRLGSIDYLLVSPHFFRPELARELAEIEGFAASFAQPSPLTLFPRVTVEKMGVRDRLAGRASHVQLLAVQPAFFAFNRGPDRVPRLIGEREVMLTRNLADELQLQVGDRLLVRLPSLQAAPEESPFGRRDSAVVTLAGLKLTEILDPAGVAGFQPYPSQQPPRNLFVNPEALQRALGRDQVANAIAVTGLRQSRAADSVALLNQMLRPTLEDLGIRVTRVDGKYRQVSRSEQRRDENEQPPLATAWSYVQVTSDNLVFRDRVAAALEKALAPYHPQLVRVYLANAISSPKGDRAVPYSMICALDPHAELGPLLQADIPVIPQGNPPPIWINRWLADELATAEGDEIQLTYFEPETSHGEPQEAVHSFQVQGILPLTRPSQPFRRDQVATFDEAPSWASDPELTPAVKGVSDRDSIEDWDPPFPFDQKRIGPADDDYWEYHRATPKAFIAAGTGESLWKSRYGSVTSIRIPIREDFHIEAVKAEILAALLPQKEEWNYAFRAIKRDNLLSASGTTPFEFLFIGFSFFLIAASLLLVALVTRLGIQSRLKAWQLLAATGWREGRIRQLLLLEFGGLGVLGGVLGIPLGIAYALAMTYGLRTWWRQAIVTPFVTLHLRWFSLVAGLLLGLVVILLVLFWGTRNVLVLPRGPEKNSPRSQLRESSLPRWIGYLVPVFILGGISLTLFALRLSGEAQAGSFFGAGFLFLVAGLGFVYRHWKNEQGSHGLLSLQAWAWRSCGRNPERSLLTAGLVAAASFLILAIGAFRMQPNHRGTGRFSLIGESDRPLYVDWSRRDDAGDVVGFSMLAGDDASCRNLYQANQPRILGVREKSLPLLQQAGRFQFAGVTDSDLTPWQRLFRSPAEDGIPVILDRNTAMYALHIPARIGTQFETEVAGTTQKFCIQGLLINSVLQGSLIIAHPELTKLEPEVSGDRFFMIDSAEFSANQLAIALEREFVDQGLDLQASNDVLRDLLAIQNTYLSTFQALGGLGLLLGTVGLGAVVARNILERRREMGLLTAIGFTPARLRKLIAWEHCLLVGIGLLIGVVAALLASLPQSYVQGSQVPWLTMAMLMVGISLVGLIANWLAMGRIRQADLLRNLLDE